MTQGAGVVRPLPGEGVVAHLNGLLLVCDASERVVEDLLAAVRDTAPSGDGRLLARRAAQILARAIDGEPASCAVAGPAGGGVAVLVSGSASATIVKGDGEVHLSGADSLTWTDRLIGGPLNRIELRLPNAGPSSPYARLDGGVVAGAGVELDLTQSREPAFRVPPPQPQPQPHPQPQSQFGPPEPISPREPVIPPAPPAPFPPPEAPPQPQQEPQPASQPFEQPFEQPFDQPYDQPFEQPPARPYEPFGPSQFDQPSGPQPPAPAPAPADEVSESTQLDSTPEPEPAAMVYGVDCKNEHFNDPRASYCAVCGVALPQRQLVPYKGARPALGALLLDDGMQLRLDGDYVLGRDPDRAAEVQSGEARPARVTSPDGSVSRRHLRVALDGWDVNLVDLGSVNGTQIQPPGDPNFYDIPPNEAVPIMPGTTVRIGVSRTMRYESHRDS